MPYSVPTRQWDHMFTTHATPFTFTRTCKVANADSALLRTPTNPARVFLLIMMGFRRLVNSILYVHDNI